MSERVTPKRDARFFQSFHSYLLDAASAGSSNQEMTCHGRRVRIQDGAAMRRERKKVLKHIKKEKESFAHFQKKLAGWTYGRTYVSYILHTDGRTDVCTHSTGGDDDDDVIACVKIAREKVTSLHARLPLLVC